MSVRWNRCVRFNRGSRRLEGRGPAEYKEALDAFKMERSRLPDSAFALIEIKEDTRYKDGRTKKFRKYPKVPRKTQISSYARAKQLGREQLAKDIFEVKDEPPAPPPSLERGPSAWSTSGDEDSDVENIFDTDVLPTTPHWSDDDKSDDPPRPPQGLDMSEDSDWGRPPALPALPAPKPKRKKRRRIRKVKSIEEFRRERAEWERERGQNVAKR